MKNYCWIISDGTMGMELQCIALAESLNLKYQIKHISPSPILTALPQFGAVPLFWKDKHYNKEFCPPFPKVSITCGRRHAGFAIALKRISKGKVSTIHIQDPRINSCFFDHLVVPEHDPSRGNNIIISKGSLTNINRNTLAAEAKRFLDLVSHLPQPRIAINIGGSSKRAVIDKFSAEKIVDKLTLLARGNDCGLMVTTSRRTDETIKYQLRKLSEKQNVLVYGGVGPNPYMGFLGLADTIIVTSDSINMISEACSTGKPVYIITLGKNNKRKQSFLDAMQQEGRTRPFDGHLNNWTYEALNETERVAAIIREKLAINNII